MASPQKEKGYTPLANEILDEICQYKFNGCQLRIILYIWRQTYGYGRKDHDFSLTYLHSNTGISERTVKKEIAGLIKANVLLVTKSSTQNSSRKLSFNKDYEAWTIPKSGDPMSDLFDHEGSDPSPREEEAGGSNTSPREGSDTSPQVVTLGGAIAPPDKESLLKKVFKEKEKVFETFWLVYPRRISKQAALKAWTKLSKEKAFDPERIISNTDNFAQTCELLQTLKQHIPHPSTYLNQKRYVDYYTVDPEGLAAEKQTKFGSNLDFLRNQLGGDEHDQGRGGSITGESVSRLPEQGTRFEE